VALRTTRKFITKNSKGDNITDLEKKRSYYKSGGRDFVDFAKWVMMGKLCSGGGG